MLSLAVGRDLPGMTGRAPLHYHFYRARKMPATGVILWALLWAGSAW